MKARAIDSLLNDIVAPAIRGLGFLGSLSAFRQPIGDAWVFVNIQRTTASIPELGEFAGEATAFTANLGIASYRILRAEGIDPQKPPPRAHWHREVRIGGFLRDGRSEWWVVPDNMAPENSLPIAADFLDALIKQGLPAIRQFTDDARLRDGWLREAAWLTPPERNWLRLLIKEIGPPSPEWREPTLAELKEARRSEEETLQAHMTVLERVLRERGFSIRQV